MTEKKTYNGRIRGDSFDVIHRCQSFAADIFIASSGATKEYRFTICKMLQTLSCELTYSARQANAIDLMNPQRKEMHEASIELMNKIADLLPVIRKCKCISMGQERELNNKLSNLKISYNKWMQSDERRISRLNNHGDNDATVGS